MLPSEDPAMLLAERLRALRETRWSNLVVTQGQLAEALGDDKPLSVPLISSWESPRNPKIPPLVRLADYATFFATSRSTIEHPYRVLDLEELTVEERARREKLFQELSELRNAAIGTRRRTTFSPSSASQAESIMGNLWNFQDDEPVVIVDTALPMELRGYSPYADRFSPDYMELFSYADPDAVIELYGHIRATNPRNNRVTYRIASSLQTEDYTNAHLVLLGGVDWNVATQDLLSRIELPVHQLRRAGEDLAGSVHDAAGFEVSDSDELKEFYPIVRQIDDREQLIEDVALFYRGPNPYNSQRTVTLCNGMFGRGTVGAVRALTDEYFRSRNQAYIMQRFHGLQEFSILTRVQVVNGRVVTPDWTVQGTVLHSWPESV